MTNRRIFIKKSILGATTLSLSGLASCTNNTPATMSTKKEIPKIKISLAQWSLNRAFFANELDAKDFATISKDTYGIDALEYVGTFYKEAATDESFWQDMKRRSDAAGTKNLLIMIDDEGDLGNTNEAERKIAVENHYKWVNAAKILGCHSIRVNAFGDGERTAVQEALIVFE